MHPLTATQAQLLRLAKDGHVAAELARRQQLRELQAAKAEQSQYGCYDENGVRQGGLIAFIRYFWHILEPDTEFIDGWPLWALCEHLEAITAGKIHRLNLNVPSGFSKSLTSNVFFRHGNGGRWGFHTTGM